MEAKKLNKVTIKEYLKLEQQESIRYEYHDGFIQAMAGGTLNHGLITGNTFGALNANLLQKNTSCFPLNNDIKLHIESENRFLYPDVMVVCNEIERSSEEKEAITNPTLIVEVLSKNTESYDRGDKFYFYRQLNSLKEYVLIEQYKAQIEIYERSESSELWRINRVIGLEETLHLNSLDLDISLKEIYRNVVFEDTSPENKM